VVLRSIADSDLNWLGVTLNGDLEQIKG